MRAELSLLAGDVVLYRAVFAVSDDRLRGDRGISLMLIKTDTMKQQNGWTLAETMRPVDTSKSPANFSFA